MTWTVAALYKFVSLDDLPKLQKTIREASERLDICGTLLLAPEGINGTIAGVGDALDEIVSLLDDLADIKLGENIKKDNSAFYDEIKELISNNQLTQAESLLEKFISENSKDVIAISMYLNCMIESSKFQETNDFISALNKEILDTHLKISQNNSIAGMARNGCEHS